MSEPQAESAEQGRGSSWLQATTALVAACVAAAHAAEVAEAAHDAGLVRTAGLGWTGGWRTLDGAVAAAVVAIPLGTRAFRAALAGACVTGVAAAALFVIVRRFLEECAPRAPAALGGAAACVATLTASLGATWQLEGGSAGGAVTGALLTMAPLAVAALAPARVGAVAFALGLAASYEPLVGAVALVSSSAFVALGSLRSGARWFAAGAAPRSLGGCFVLGLAPALLAAAGARHAFAPWPRFAASAGEGGAGGGTSVLHLLDAEAGWLLLGLAVAGVALAAVVPRARPLAGALVVLALAGLAAILTGAPAGPSRFGAPVVAAFGALVALAAVGMQALVRIVAAARIPFARTSAALVVLLLLTFPVTAADDSLTRALARTSGAAVMWDETAWGTLAAGSLLVLTDPRLVPRVAAAHAGGSLRSDVTIVPAFDLESGMARRALAHEAKLVPFWRDIELEGEPGEWSLSSLAAGRPLAVSYDPKWGRELARHLVPLGLVTRFAPEPRGASDRRRALDDLLPQRARLLEAIAKPRDPELLDATTILLRARAIALAASGDRDLLGRGLEDLFAFSPGDRIATEILRRAATSKGGPFETKDLSL